MEPFGSIKSQRKPHFSVWVTGACAALRGPMGHHVGAHGPQRIEKYKEKFFKDLMLHLNNNFKKNENIIILGDLNISPEDIDIGIGEDNRKRWLATGKCSFLPEEREWLQKIKDWGFKDSYRKFYPDSDDKYSWFDYRSRGFDDSPKRGLRIDHLWVTESLLEMAKGADIDYEIRGMEKPSDHAPVWTEFNF